MNVSDHHTPPWLRYSVHILSWLLYLIASVWFHAGDVDSGSVMAMMPVYIMVFYTYAWWLRGLAKAGTRQRFLLRYTLPVVAGSYLLAYGWVHRVLPLLGIPVIDPDWDFNWADIVRELSVGLFRLGIYAGLYVALREAVDAWQRYRTDKEDRKRLELKSLGRELTAHTQFGMLQHLQYKLVRDRPEAGDYVAELAGLYDYHLRGTQQELVPLSAELEQLRRVAVLLSKPYVDTDPSWLQVHGEVIDHPLPPMALISLFENACKYGDLSRPGNLRLHIEASPQTLRILCINRIGQTAPVVRSGRIGLRNLGRRLELLFPGRATLDKVEIAETHYAILQICYHEKV